MLRNYGYRWKALHLLWWDFPSWHRMESHNSRDLSEVEFRLMSPCSMMSFELYSAELSWLHKPWTDTTFVKLCLSCSCLRIITYQWTTALQFDRQTPHCSIVWVSSLKLVRAVITILSSNIFLICWILRSHASCTISQFVLFSPRVIWNQDMTAIINICRILHYPVFIKTPWFSHFVIWQLSSSSFVGLLGNCGIFGAPRSILLHALKIHFCLRCRLRFCLSTSLSNQLPFMRARKHRSARSRSPGYSMHDLTYLVMSPMDLGWVWDRRSDPPTSIFTYPSPLSSPGWKTPR